MWNASVATRFFSRRRERALRGRVAREKKRAPPVAVFFYLSKVYHTTR
jgi:hypothetical protein